MSALYGWMSSDKKRVAATAGGHKYMHLVVAYERGGQDYRVCAGNEIRAQIYFPDKCTVPHLSLYLPEEIELWLTRTVEDRSYHVYPTINLTRQDVETEMEGEMEDWSPSNEDLQAIAGQVGAGLMEAYWIALREVCASYIEAYKEEIDERHSDL